ncbi:DUF3276 family protein [Riemerella columbipharyngis]|uniref:DNA-binding protein n=1 Tax=Riemerella columbipharyngis TaxID=1071918 RepID=A0A1G7ETK8_9FLAO|nr:DUF3276 family protein [Riemerella columbipharyngis]SDE66969.1 Protein of unknown function [Riemerella columbipharyngis]
MNDYNDKHRENEIFTKVLKAGRRTYFFDVRETKAGDYYLTITESKKHIGDSGDVSFEKHKIYLYKEDFNNFSAMFNEAAEFIIKEKGEDVISEKHNKDFNNKSFTIENGNEL